MNSVLVKSFIFYTSHWPTKPHVNAASILKAAEADIETRQTSRKLTSQLERGSGFGEFVGTSKIMREVYELIQSLSSSDGTRHQPELAQ